MKDLKIGLLGMSKGNGHPYSWSAIINGSFEEKEMNKCGFEGIPVYLEANKSTLGIDGAVVTHIWTQDRDLSEHIARSSGIENVVTDVEEMIGEIDAVILARDDPENHVAMAKPFLDADIPVFIDKPLAFSDEDLDYFIDQNKNGKFLMSCSSMRYSYECSTLKTELNFLGDIKLATVVGVKDWKKYGVHMLEAMFSLLDDPKVKSVRHLSESGKDIVLIKFENGLLATVHLFMDISVTFQLSVYGSTGWKLVEIKNSYTMFKENLIDFIKSVRKGKPNLSFEKTINIIRTLIAADKSLKSDGVLIHLDNN